MEDKKDKVLNIADNEETIIGVLDGKELTDEKIKEVSGGCGEVVVLPVHSCDQ